MKVGRMLSAGLLAAGIAMGGVACGSSHVAKNPTTTPSKSNLPDLSDGMILPQSGFPSAADGTFKVTAVRKLDPMPNAEECSLNSLLREGGQEAGSRMRGDTGDYVVEIFHTGTAHDVHEWANRCLPMNEKDSTKKVSELPGLPVGAIGIAADKDGTVKHYLVLGFVRGILVAASVDGGKQGLLPAGAKSDVVKLFNNQAELLNSY